MGEWIQVIKSLPEKTGLHLVKQKFFDQIVEDTAFYVAGSGWYTYADMVVEWSPESYNPEI